jgi:MFS family permease
MIQSSGSSGTVALANAVISDIVTSAERGTNIGYASMGVTVGPAFGPIIGGLLNQFLGWRAIFWFLTIFSGIVFLVIIISLPETCRKIVGNGSIPTRSWNMSLLIYLQLRRQHKAGIEAQQTSKSGFKARPNPLKSIYIILQKECSFIIFYAGTLFGGLYMVLSSMPAEFGEKYNFNTLQIGLCYIPTGLGSMLSSLVVGKFLNWNFRRHARLRGMEIVDKKQQDLTNFPIEAARLQVVVPLVYIAAATIVSYGWVMMNHTSLAGPVILLFISTFCMSGSFTGLSALVVDLNRTSPGAATAAMNVVRCWMGAGAVAFVNPLLTAIGLGWTSVMVAGVWILISPIVLVIIRRGPRWREEKRLKEQKKDAETESTRQAATCNEEGISGRTSKDD